MTTIDTQQIYTGVQNGYSQIASQTPSTTYSTTVASAFGYSSSDLAQNPAESNLGLSCGNPIALASLREGETVIDLGSGAGFDVFQAARKVGEKGKVVGVDMNEEMLAKATSIASKTHAQNVEFIHSPITAISLPDEKADCIISNCVINLVPASEKHLVFREIFRLLRKGGRVAVSDILLNAEGLPEELRGNMALYVGCIAGAARVWEYEDWLIRAGFEDVLIVPDESDLNVYKSANKGGEGASTEKGCCGNGCGGNVARSKNEKSVVEDEKWLDVDFNEWAGSYKIYAVKP